MEDNVEPPSRGEKTIPPCSDESIIVLPLTLLGVSEPASSGKGGTESDPSVAIEVGDENPTKI